MKHITQSLLAMVVLNWQGCAMTMPAHFDTVAEPAPLAVQSKPAVSAASSQTIAWQNQDRRTAATVPEIDRAKGQSGD